MLSFLTRDTARRLYEKATEAGALYEKATEAGALCLASVSEGAIKTLLRILTQLYYGHTNVGRRCISHLSPSRFCIASRLWYLSGTSLAPLRHLSGTFLSRKASASSTLSPSAPPMPSTILPQYSLNSALIEP